MNDESPTDTPVKLAVGNVIKGIAIDYRTIDAACQGVEIIMRKDPSSAEDILSMEELAPYLVNERTVIALDKIEQYSFPNVRRTREFFDNVSSFMDNLIRCRYDDIISHKKYIAFHKEYVDFVSDTQN
jgi:hypothetical protein